MKDNGKILVAYDGSVEAQKAVREAVTLSKKFNASITLLHVYWDPEFSEAEEKSGSFENIPIMNEGRLKVLSDIEPFLKDSGVEYLLRSENHPHAAKTILRIAQEDNFDLITIGNRGLGGARSWILGSVSNEVVANAHCPVLVT